MGWPRQTVHPVQPKVRIVLKKDEEFFLEEQPFLGKSGKPCFWLKREGCDVPVAVFGSKYRKLAEYTLKLLNTHGAPE